MRRYPQAWVVPRHLQHQRADGLRRARPSGSPVRVHPAPPDQVGVPPKKGSRGDDQAQLAKLAGGQQPCQRGQERPVSPGQPRRSSLALENGDLVAQDKDLGLFGTA
jgi:hypothetical protein